MKNPEKKAKIFAMVIVSFVVFAMTFFAMAENQNDGNLFLDSDQDGLTDQEEKMIGTDPAKADTDGDGYSDGKEVESGYNPLKPAPGDKIVASQTANTSTEPTFAPADVGTAADGQPADLLSADAITDLSSDPNNPNLTNELIGQLMQLTTEKAAVNSGFAENPIYSAEDYSQIAQKALETTSIAKDLPDIPDSELKILPAVDSKKLEPEEIKSRQKAEIEKYLAQIAFVFASHSPFSVQNTSDLESNIASESTNIISALATGNKSAVDSYAQKAQAGIDQLKKIEVPFVLKDIHKSMLQLATFTLGLKDDIAISSTDPMKSLAAASSLQAIAGKATQLQEDFSKILSEYGIDSFSLP